MPTEMLRCETCRHWIPPGAETTRWDEQDGNGFGICNLMRNVSKPDFYATAESNDPADILSAPHFVCVAHEPRD